MSIEPNGKLRSEERASPVAAVSPLPVLSVRNLSVSFTSVDGTARVVENVSFDVASGEMLAVVGESGSGKSVTAKSIMRLIDYMGGRIEGGDITLRPHGAEAIDITTAPEDTLRRIRGKAVSLVFQEPMTSLNPVLSIGEQIGEAIRLHEKCSAREVEERSLAALRQVRIPEAEKRLRQYPHELSGGMRQRVMIAIALACKPSLLIADEPTTALDVTIQAEILTLIKILQQEIGMGVLFITHDMGVVAEIADRVMVMRHGRKVEEGSVESIFESPQHPYTRALLAAVPKLGSMRGKRSPEPFSMPLSADAAIPASAATRPAVEDRLPTHNSPVLEVDGLTVRFPIHKGFLKKVVANVHAVENVSFKLYPGETLALVGESGSGKSTTGRAILKLIEADSGDIIINGLNITNYSQTLMRPVRNNVQMVFQDPFASLNPRMTVAQLIAEPLHIQGRLDAAEISARVKHLLDRVELPVSSLGRYAFEFSGGQRQRICIARALALNPAIIVADEAVSALDVSIRAQVLNLMMELQKELGLSYLFISHDMAVVERVSHRVAVMYLGEIVEIGPRDAVISTPAHPYTRRLIASVPIADPRQRRVRQLSATEINSAVKPVGYRPAERTVTQVGEDHFMRS
ncbi:ABC transporter ATP-binding protein [Pseudomonas sp. R2.Fl]|nr:ABC transporter ATP-binding protein [Pseudomonas sp. R2.Fl]